MSLIVMFHPFLKLTSRHPLPCTGYECLLVVCTKVESMPCCNLINAIYSRFHVMCIVAYVSSIQMCLLGIDIVSASSKIKAMVSSLNLLFGVDSLCHSFCLMMVIRIGLSVSSICL